MIEAYPLAWPDGWKRTKYPTQSAFKLSGFGRARDFLLAEIRRMGGTKTILSTNISLRNDGLPYANQAQPKDPGVAVYFTYKGRSMVFACDRWRKVEENAYAIGKTIEAIRGIERWGASDMMERAFTGFTALTDGSQKPWRAVLGFEANAVVTVTAVEDRFTELAKIHHPDRGGSTERFQELTEARRAARIELTN